MVPCDSNKLDKKGFEASDEKSDLETRGFIVALLRSVFVLLAPLVKDKLDGLDSKSLGFQEDSPLNVEFSAAPGLSAPLSVPSSFDSSLMPRVALSRWSSSSGEGSAEADRGKLRERVYKRRVDC